MDIDIIIVGLYLAATLIIGVWSGWKISTFRNYAINDRSTSTFALCMTIAATYIGGGSTIGMAEKAFSSGIVFPVIYFLGSLNLFFIGLFIAPKMEAYLDKAQTPGSLAGLFWGHSGEFTVGVVGLFLSLGGVAAQISAMGLIFHELMGVSFELGACIGFGVLVMYSALGGIRAVVSTDTIQFMILAISMPLLAYLAVTSAGGLDHLLASVPESHLTLAPMRDQPMRYIPVLVSFLLFLLAPTWIQRLLMGKDIRQLRKSFCTSTLVTSGVFICSAIIGLSALVVDPNIPSQLAMPYMIQTVMPVGMKGLMIAGLLAAIMSTADSDLNVSGIMVVRDLIRAYRGTMTDRQMIRYSQYATLIFGVLALLVALRFKSIIDILLYFNGFWCGTVLVPLSARLLGHKSSKYAFIWAAVMGILVVISWIAFDLEQHWGIYGLFPGMLVNTIVFFTMNAYSKRCGIFAQELEQARLAQQQALEWLDAYEKPIPANDKNPYWE
ncbi:MAG: sodium:solute symporter family protein [Holosporales bacterium]|jgi:SSS family solute:Na+ symporter|nr:sodium:solute symporter family protein [Holosporales bacterium]